METVKLSIEGMGCGHCVASVKKELSKLDAKINDISIGSAELEIDENKVKTADIENAIKEAGYNLVSLEKL